MFCIDFKAFIRLAIDKSWLVLSASSAIDFISLIRRHSVDELVYLSLLFFRGMVGRDVRRLKTSVELLPDDELPPVSFRRVLLKLLVDVFDDFEIFKLL